MERVRKLRTVGRGRFGGAGSKALLGLAMAGLYAAAAMGQTAPVPTSTHPLLAAFPEALQMGPPQWVRPGTRIVTHMGTAAITYGGGRGPNSPLTRASGQGFVVYDVVAIAGTRVALEVRTYVSLNGQLSLGGITGQLSLAAVSDVWVHPDLLQRALGMNGQGEVVAVRMPYPMNGKTVDAIRLDYRARMKANPGSYSSVNSYTYDAKSGALLLMGLDNLNNIAQQRLAGIRTINLPWARVPAPGWVANARVLRYSGASTTSVPGAASFAYPVTSELLLGQRGPDWAAFEYRATIRYGQGMPPQSSSTPRISGSAQIGSIWIAPAALAQLRAGQTIDTDPFTRIQTVVKYVGPSRSGSYLVVIAERTQGLEMEYGYDRQTGLMVFASSTTQSAMSRTRIEVRFAGRN